MCSMDTINYRLVASEGELEKAFEVRKRVFVSEQGIAENLEWDGSDGEALHMVVKEYFFARKRVICWSKRGTALSVRPGFSF